MSALPKVIQDQVDQADTLQQQLYPVDTAPAEAEQPAPEPVAEQPSNVVELPKPQAAPEPTPQPAREETVDYWKSRFDTLRGKFDAEVPTLHQQLKEQAAQLNQLKAALDEKQSQPEPKDKPKAHEKFVEDYGGDMVEMVTTISTSVVRDAVAQEIASLRKEFGAMQDQVGFVSEQVVMSESDKFWTGVMALVPEWKQIDNDPSWVEWLNSTPEFGEDTYREMAGKAIQKRNAQKIAALVKKWKSDTGVPAATVKQAQVQDELQRQVTPSASRASTPVNPGERIWSAEDFSAAYDVRNVKRLGAQEASRLVAEADRAAAEGRVRW